MRRRRFTDDLRSRGISDEGVLRAMAAVPRERFIDEALQAKAYEDCSLPIGEGQTISQPWVVARMAEALKPNGEGRALEVGTGSGYHAAVLALLFEQVYSIERIPSLSRRALATIRAVGIENVHLKIFDGSYGWGEFAPYRAIVVTAAAPEVPPPLLDQLEDGGRLVIPIASRTESPKNEGQLLTLFVRKGAAHERVELGPCRFVPLLGRYGTR